VVARRLVVGVAARHSEHDDVFGVIALQAEHLRGEGRVGFAIGLLRAVSRDGHLCPVDDQRIRGFCRVVARSGRPCMHRVRAGIRGSRHFGRPLRRIVQAVFHHGAGHIGHRLGSGNRLTAIGCAGIGAHDGKFAGVHDLERGGREGDGVVALALHASCGKGIRSDILAGFT